MIQCHNDLVIGPLFIIIAHVFLNTPWGFLLASSCGLCLKGLKEGKGVGAPWVVIIPYGIELCKQLLLAEQHVPWAEKTELERETDWECKRREFLSSLEDLTMSHNQIDPTSCLLHRQLVLDISWKCLLWWANSEIRPASVCASHVSYPRRCVQAFPRSMPALEQNLSRDSKSIGSKEQLTLNKDKWMILTSSHSTSQKNLAVCNARLRDVQHKRN